MTPRQPTGPDASGASDLIRVAIVMLAAGFVLTAGGSLWVVLTPLGTGVDFPAGLLYLLGLAVGILGLALGTAAFTVVSRATRRPRS